MRRDALEPQPPLAPGRLDEEAPGSRSDVHVPHPPRDHQRCQEVAAQELPAGYGYEFSGLTREELASGSETIFIFILCLVFVYFLLSAQYESYILPLAVILSIPTGILGAFAGVKAVGLDNNIYVQVGLIMLVGLLAKNAILIVEFAVQRRKAGKSLIESALQASRLRLRPILMTSFAFIAGMVPLIGATGAGAIGNHTIGASALGGMFFGTVFGVVVIPGLYYIFAKMADGRKIIKNEEEGPLSEEIELFDHEE